MEMTAGMTAMPASLASDVPAAGAAGGPAAAASPSDEELVEQLRDGSAAAGETLVKRYFQPLMRYLVRIVGSDHLAEELHQQTWLSVLDHIDRFDIKAGSSSGGFKAWLFRIATNKANDHWRGSARGFRSMILPRTPATGWKGRSSSRSCFARSRSCLKRSGRC